MSADESQEATGQLNSRHNIIQKSRDGFVHIQFRTKRQAESRIDFESEDASLKFYIGFQFDGLDKYKNLSETEELRQFAELKIFTNPTVYRMENTTEFQKDTLLSIRVNICECLL